jgi:UDP-glucose 6-dehydrogenase
MQPKFSSLVIRELMLKNKWINPMHTLVSGTDNKLSYGGGCFPKDTNALVSYMKRLDSPFLVLDDVIKERNLMRTDHTNVKLSTTKEDNK